MNIDEALKLIDSLLEPQKLNNLQEIIFRQSWEQKTYTQIAANSGYTDEYIRDRGAQLWHLLSELLSETITKQNFKAVLQRYDRRPNKPNKWFDVSTQYTKCNLAWKQAIDVSLFFGHHQELTTLEKWIVEDNCRLVGIFGMNGIGKTALAIKLAQNIESKFDYVIWLSLKHKPSFEQFLTNILQVFDRDRQSENNLLFNDTDKISQLLECCYRYRCLLILDRVEEILESEVYCGHYAPEFDQYGELFQRLGETYHQSCLLLTSAEKPQEFFWLEGDKLPVRSLHIPGIKPVVIKKITQFKGNLSGSESDWQTLTNNYGGNALVLKLVAATIKNIFNGSIQHFLAQKILLSKKIDNLLNKQFSRLSPVEKQILLAIAIKNKPITFPELQQDLVNYISAKESIEGIESLQGRSLIQKRKNYWNLHPYIQEYVINQLTETSDNETSTENRIIIPLPLCAQFCSISNCLNGQDKSSCNHYYYWNLHLFPCESDLLLNQCLCFKGVDTLLSNTNS